MRVAMLGPLSLRDAGDREIEVGGLRLRMLLARLALDANRIVSSESLIDGLWGERPPVDATNALQSLVSRLRKVGIAKQLESHPVGYSLTATDVDVHTFERLATEGSRLLRDGQATHAAETLREALELWRGPALVDVVDAPFAAPAVARLVERRLTATEDRIDADIQRGRDSDVIVELYALTHEHPLRERLAGLLVRALHGAGRQADALAAYDTTRKALADELGVDPGRELREIHLAVLRDEPQSAVRTGLPAQLTSFVGRGKELREVRTLLTEGRLVTLVGPGGAGKTRLATEAAAGTTNTVWFVPLAGLREAVDVPAALATALGVGDQRVVRSPAVLGFVPGDITQRLVDVLAGRADLLVLDNCEHLVSAAAELADRLLAGCPRLRIMATSREPLAITGERLVPVGPLDLPDEETSPDEAVRHAAVRLFLDRAVAVRPGFQVDEQNVSSVVAICRQLDGLPLALELAAARLRSMTVGQVAERLDDRFRLLTAGSRTSLPRHQTLGAVVDWSWSLLGDRERTLATRLSVFATSSTVDAIAAVCAGPDLPSGDVMYVLASLVEKSFVEALEGADGVPRYRMLQTVRAFAADRLADADETRAGFTRYVLDLIEDLEPRLRGHDQAAALSTLDAEHENVLAAVRIAADMGDGDTAYRIVAAWTWYWMMRQGIFGEVRARTALPFDRLRSLADQAPVDAYVTMRLLELAISPSFPEHELIRELSAACRSVGAGSRYPLLVLIGPVAHMIVGEFDAALAEFRRALRLRDPWVRAAVMVCGGLAVVNMGQLDRAERWFVRGTAAFEALGDRWGQMLALSGLAEIRSVHGDIAGAEQALAVVVRIESDLGPIPNPPMAWTRMADLRYRAGDLEGAERQLREALRISEDQVQPTVALIVRCRLGMVARARGHHAEARAHVTAAREVLADVEAGAVNQLPAWIDTVEVWLLADEGRVAEARGVAAAAFAAIQRGFMQDHQSLAALGEALAAVAIVDGDVTLAARLLGASAAFRGAMDIGSPDVRALLDHFGPAERHVLAEAQQLAVPEALAVLTA
jgi:predicted ATPase/DNA-binding SARP family transcriptional activator/tetratricopeptide (TPR) repeat protein